MFKRTRLGRRLRHLLIYPVEAALIHLFYHVFAWLPIDAASALGGWLGRLIGPLLSRSRQAMCNLERALPELTAAQRHIILRGMWDNLGRTMAEHPHLARIWNDRDTGRLEVPGAEYLPKPAAGEHRPCLIFSGHIGNWELLPVAASGLGLVVTSVFRQPNNPMLNRLMIGGRHAGQGRLVPKGREGARQLFTALTKGDAVAMLVDQKMNDGIAVPFFGHSAMTAPALAQLALKFRCPVLPTRIERLGGARFRLSVLPPFEIANTGNRELDIQTFMTAVNQQLESWIREHPEQWLWLHHRWPSA